MNLVLTSQLCTRGSDLNQHTKDLEHSTNRPLTAQVPDCPLGDTETDLKSTTKALKTDLTVKPQPTKGGLKFKA